MGSKHWLSSHTVDAIGDDLHVRENMRGALNKTVHELLGAGYGIRGATVRWGTLQVHCDYNPADQVIAVAGTVEVATPLEYDMAEAAADLYRADQRRRDGG